MTDADTKPDKRTFGERLSDNLAAFGQSWNFLIAFFVTLIVWMAFNGVAQLVDPTFAFDPYPFILLNLALSCLAAIQAPVIMMSQGRAEARDREKTRHIAQLEEKIERQIVEMQGKLDFIYRYVADRGNF